MTGSSSVLPSYQRFVNGVPVSLFSRRSFRPRGKYLILLVSCVLSFGVVCFGMFFFLPDFRSGTGGAAVNSVYRVYQHMQKAGPELLIPAPPRMQMGLKGPQAHPNDVPPGHEGADHQDVHLLEDKQKLQAKIDEEYQQQKTLEKPEVNVGDSRVRASSWSSVVVHRKVDVPETVPPAPADKLPLTIGGEDEDLVARERRDKVKEVHGFLNEETSWANIANFMINLSFYYVSTTRYLGLLLNLHNIRKLLHTLQAQRSKITDVEERKIISAQDLYTMAMCRSYMNSILLTASSLMWYTFLEMYFPRDLPATVRVYYFPNNPSLWYLKLLHMHVYAAVSCASNIGFDCASYTTSIHVHGLFLVTKYRCEVAFDKSEGLSPVEQQKVETQNVRDIVTIHVQGMKGQTKWYKGTVTSQKMTLFIMINAQPISFSHLNNLFVANLDGFAWYIRVAYSYFTVLSSL